MKKLLWALCCLPLLTSAQSYPTDYFRNPLNIPILLAGNFGECRGGHFHSGLDIKTNGKEDLPVFAAAEGYVSRIKMDKGGFGHAIYITHPNGYTTLYAHLNKFAPKLQKYLREQQYKAQKWDLDLQLNPEQFPLKKGEQIAFSGNTGSSTAPHLHFEIRDSKTEHPLNPQLFGFSITDTKAPIPLELAVYDLRKSIYEQTPRLITLKNIKGDYTPSTGETIVTNSTITGLGIHVNDYMNGSDNTLNFYTARVFINDELQTAITLDDIGYDVTRYLHAYADYKTKEQKNKWIQCLFQLPGNKLDHIYTHANSQGGKISMAVGEELPVRIELTDNSGNTSLIRFVLKADEISGDGPKACDADFKVAQENAFDDLNVTFKLPENALYDDVCFLFAKKEQTSGYSSAYSIHRSFVPVHTWFDLNIKAEKSVPFELRDKLAMIYNDGKSENGRSAAYSDKGWYAARVRNFGTYYLAADTTAPVIKPLSKTGASLANAKQVSFIIKDDLTSVAKYSAEINNKWILLEQHGNTFFYEFDERCPKGKVTMLIKAEDENGNKSSLRYTFNR